MCISRPYYYYISRRVYKSLFSLKTNQNLRKYENDLFVKIKLEKLPIEVLKNK